jgi:hypothetical protein
MQQALVHSRGETKSSNEIALMLRTDAAVTRRRRRRRRCCCCCCCCCAAATTVSSRAAAAAPSAQAQGWLLLCARCSARRSRPSSAGTLWPVIGRTLQVQPTHTAALSLGQQAARVVGVVSEAARARTHTHLLRCHHYCCCRRYSRPRKETPQAAHLQSSETDARVVSTHRHTS